MPVQSIPLWDLPDAVHCAACGHTLVSGMPWLEGRVHAVTGRTDCPPNLAAGLANCGRCAGAVVPAQGGWRHAEQHEKCTATIPTDKGTCVFCMLPIRWSAAVVRWVHTDTGDRCCAPDDGGDVCSRCGSGIARADEGDHSDGPVCHAVPAGTRSTQPGVTGAHPLLTNECVTCQLPISESPVGWAHDGTGRISCVPVAAPGDAYCLSCRGGIRGEAPHRRHVRPTAPCIARPKAAE